MLSQDGQLVLRGRLVLGDLLRLQKLEAAIVLDVLLRVAGVDRDDSHTLALGLEVHDGHIGEDLVGARPEGKTALGPGVPALEPGERKRVTRRKAPAGLAGKPGAKPKGSRRGKVRKK